MRFNYLIIIMTLLLACTGASQPQKLSAGLELSLAFKETIAAQRVELEDFIFKAKYTRAEKDERLKLIEERQTSFNLALDEIARERAELKEALAKNIITQEAFTAGMRAIGLKVAESSRSIKTVENALAELGKELAEKQRQKFAVVEEKQRELKKRIKGEEESETTPPQIAIEGNETPAQKIIEKINESRRRGEK